MPIRACRWRPLGDHWAGSGGGGSPSSLALSCPFPGPPVPPTLPLAPTSECPAHTRPPPTAGPPLQRAPSSRNVPRLFQASLTPSLGTWSVPANTLGLAQRPRKCGAAAKLRPASPVFTGIVGRRPGGPPNSHTARGVDGHSGLAAVRPSPSRDRPPRQLCRRSGPRGVWGCTLPD